MKTLFKWARRLAVLAAVVAVARRVFGTGAPSGQTGSETAPTIGGDTWPPVPPNPGRTD